MIYMIRATSFRNIDIAKKNDCPNRRKKRELSYNRVLINRSFVPFTKVFPSLIECRPGVDVSRVEGLVKVGRKRAGYTAVTHASWVV